MNKDVGAFPVRVPKGCCAQAYSKATEYLFGKTVTFRDLEDDAKAGVKSMNLAYETKSTLLLSVNG